MEAPGGARVLVAAFEPFEGRAVNRALEAATLLSSDTGLPRVTLPVDFARLREVIPSLVERCGGALVLVGESATAARAQIERIAINLIDARIPDNAGAMPRDCPVVVDGPAAHFATWPARALLDVAHEGGGDAELSAHAGTFACNAALYLALDHASKLAVRHPGSGRAAPAIGLLHVPANPQFADDRAAVRLLRLLVAALT